MLLRTVTPGAGPLTGDTPHSALLILSPHWQEGRGQERRKEGKKERPLAWPASSLGLGKSEAGKAFLVSA